MAVWSDEQRVAIVAAQQAIAEINQVCSDAHDLFHVLRVIDEVGLVNGNLDADATFAAAITKWVDIKTRMVAAAQALP